MGVKNLFQPPDPVAKHVPQFSGRNCTHNVSNPEEKFMFIQNGCYIWRVTCICKHTQPVMHEKCCFIYAVRGLALSM
jgi:hypothetical protein